MGSSSAPPLRSPAHAKIPKDLLLLPIGTASSGWPTPYGSPPWCSSGLDLAAVAIQGFHSQAGWLAFNAIGLGLVVASRERLPRPIGRRRRPGRSHVSGGRFLVPLFCHRRHDDGHRGLLRRRSTGLPAPRPGGGRRPLDLPSRLRRLAMDLVVAGAAIGAAAFVLWMALEPGRLPRAIRAEAWRTTGRPGRGLAGRSASSARSWCRWPRSWPSAAT